MLPRLKKQIAPRLASGDSRVPFMHGLPEEIKEGLREIARMEGKSMSWVLEDALVRYFGLDAPQYKLPLRKNGNGRSRNGQHQNPNRDRRPAY